MATIDDPSSTRTGPRRFRWTSEQYYKVAELGYFDKGRVELIGGEIWQVTINPPHARSMERVARKLINTFGPEYRVRIQSTLDLGRRNQPEPDAAVLFEEATAALVHPKSALLVIEVGDSSLRKDRTIMAHLYALAGVQDYWIVNIDDRQLEVHRNPGPDPTRRGRSAYADVTIVPEAGNMAPLAAPGSPIAAAGLLP